MIAELLTELAPGPRLAEALYRVDVDSLDADESLSFLEAVRAQQSWTDALRLRAVARFAEVHDDVPAPTKPGCERLLQMGGTGTPRCGSFAADELGPALGMSKFSAGLLMADALDVKHRMPGLLALLRIGQADAWRVRMVAAKTRELSLESAAAIEDTMLRRINRVTRLELTRLVDAAASRLEPEVVGDAETARAQTRQVGFSPSQAGHIDVWATMAAGPAIRLDARLEQYAEMLAVVHPELEETKDQRRARALGVLADPAAAQALEASFRRITGQRSDQADGEPTAPPATVYVHLRPDSSIDVEGCGVFGMAAARELRADCQVTVKPVIDLAHMSPSTGYQPSDSLCEGVMLANPTCVFPHCGRDARTAQKDHSIAYPRGQTVAENLGPLCDHHHHVKTHGRGWRLAQPLKGIFVWQSPTGRIYVVDDRQSIALAAA